MELIGTFPNLTLKDIRYLTLYDKLYIAETLADIRNYFFRYLLEMDKITSLTLSRITIMYFKHYFLLKDDQVFLIFYKTLCEKYQKQGKNFPKGLQNIVELCSLFDENLPYEIADNCVYIKENTNLLIKNIMNERFPIIHYDTDLYNETIKNIGIICYENIKNDFYFNILISEILKLPIPKEQMDEIVSRIIELYSDENEINLNIKNGEIFGLIGSNGAGKTTLIKILSTLLYPSEGKVSILSLDIKDSERKIRNNINFIFGGERGLYWRLSAMDNLLFFGDLYKIPRKILIPRIEQLLKKVKLYDVKDERVETYSKGMKQRLQIARGLLNDPQVIFMDEPTIGLDPIGSKNLREIILELKKAKKSILITSHDMWDIEKLCDRIAFIEKGKLLCIGSIDEIKNKYFQSKDVTLEDVFIKVLGDCNE